MCLCVFAQDEYELYMAALLDSQPTAQYQVITLRKDTKRACVFADLYLRRLSIQGAPFVSLLGKVAGASFVKG